jgi:DNA polymerase beta palm
LQPQWGKHSSVNIDSGWDARHALTSSCPRSRCMRWAWAPLTACVQEVLAGASQVTEAVKRQIQSLTGCSEALAGQGLHSRALGSFCRGKESTGDIDMMIIPGDATPAVCCKALLAALISDLHSRGIATSDIPAPEHSATCSCAMGYQHSATWLGACYVPGALHCLPRPLICELAVRCAYMQRAARVICPMLIHPLLARIASQSLKCDALSTAFCLCRVSKHCAPLGHQDIPRQSEGYSGELLHRVRPLCSRSTLVGRSPCACGGASRATASACCHTFPSVRQALQSAIGGCTCVGRWPRRAVWRGQRHRCTAVPDSCRSLHC